jgi:hypothetical protein
VITSNFKTAAACAAMHDDSMRKRKKDLSIHHTRLRVVPKQDFNHRKESNLAC